MIWQEGKLRSYSIGASLLTITSGYIPPRAQWNTKPATPPVAGRALSPIEASPIHSSIKSHTRRPSETYYEDIDPRFAEEPQLQSSPPPATNVTTPSSHPSSLQAARGRTTNQNNLTPDYQPGPIPNYHDMRHESTESLQDGQRSPAISDASHYTSVSQRGINPNWRPPPGSGPQGLLPRRPQQQQDMVLNSNPEFSLPGLGPAGRGGRGGPGGFRGRGGSGMSRGAPMGMGGLGPASAGGRYPGAI